MVIHVHNRVKPWMMTAGMHSTSSRRLIFDELMIALELTGMILYSAMQVMSNEVYPEASVSFVLEARMPS